MKILYVEHSLNGHRKKYLEKLTDNFNKENCYTIIISSEDNSELKKYINVEIINSNFTNKRTLREYKKMLEAILKIANEKKVDIIHFLDGDLYYRFFGLYINKLKKYKVIITFHHVYMYGWRKRAIKEILKKINYGVVHTQFLKEQFNKMKCNNIYHVEYPVFEYNRIVNLKKNQCRKALGLNSDERVIAVLGGTQKYKGLNILLEALNTVNKDFKLVIAGKESDFSKEYIEEHIANYKSKVCLILKKLSDEEYNNVLVAADIIALPYLKVFNGASGPLADGVVASKMIIGSDYGSLGNLIENNHIGFTFSTGDSESLSELLNNVICEKNFKYDNIALKYKKNLNVEIFKKRYNNLYKICLDK